MASMMSAWVVRSLFTTVANLILILVLIHYLPLRIVNSLIAGVLLAFGGVQWWAFGIARASYMNNQDIDELGALVERAFLTAIAGTFIGILAILLLISELAPIRALAGLGAIFLLQGITLHSAPSVRFVWRHYDRRRT